MKTIKFILILCVSTLFVTSCKKEVDMTLVQKTILENVDIRKIEVSDAWEVTVVADDCTYVELEYSAYLENNIQVKLNGTKLDIGFNSKVYPAINSVYRAVVHTDKMERIKTTKAATLRFQGHFSATSDTLYIDMEKASVCSGFDYSGRVCEITIEDSSHFLDFHLSGVNCEVEIKNASTCKGSFDMSSHLAVNLDEASQLVTFGDAAPFGMIRLQGASFLNMVQTEIREMHVELSGQSEATVNVNEHMEGTLKEASILYYVGNPVINVECSDSSQLVSL